MKFSEWMAIREETQGVLGTTRNILGAIGTNKDPAVSKMIASIVDDKSGDPKKIRMGGVKAATSLRDRGKKAAMSGKFADALDAAAEASKIDKITSTIK
jgi:hypothetical protein